MSIFGLFLYLAVLQYNIILFIKEHPSPGISSRNAILIPTDLLYTSSLNWRGFLFVGTAM